MKNRTKKICTLSLFCALAFASLFIVKFKASFLTFDLKDVFLCMGAMFIGPLEGIITALVASLIEMISVSDTGIYGFVMNFVSSACYAYIASYIYRKNKSAKGAIIGLAAASLSDTLIMLLLNLLITPIYLKCDIGDVIKIIPTLLLPFNLIKYFMNSAVVLLIYKPISNALKKAKLISGECGYKKRTSVMMLIITLLIAALCIVSILVFLNGSLDFFNA